MTRDILDVGEILQNDRLVREKAGGEDGSGGVFVAARPDRPLQSPSPFHNKTLHCHGAADCTVRYHVFHACRSPRIG